MRLGKIVERISLKMLHSSLRIKVKQDKHQVQMNNKINSNSKFNKVIQLMKMWK